MGTFNIVHRIMHERTYSADTPFSYLPSEPARVRPQIRNQHYELAGRGPWLADHGTARVKRMVSDASEFRSHDLQSHNLTRCQLRHCVYMCAAYSRDYPGEWISR